MTRSFADKVAVVTGAASGIGAALVRRLLAEGARVAASDIDELPETGARRYRLDVADRDAVHAHAAAVAAEFGRVDLVVNNAGVALKGTVAQMSDEELRWVMDVNFWGVVHGTRAFLPHLVAARGSVVNISSAFGLIAVPSLSAYNASKFAVRGFTEALRQEMAGTGVGVTCVHPGGIKTNIARKGRTSDPSEKADFNRSLDKVAITSPDAAARRILDGARKDKARVLVGPDAYAIDLLPRLLGSLYQPLVNRLFRAGQS
ncbi:MULTISPECIES: SDR family NAD(P)-dependent oxidoreductase [Actinokineospora]|uniref:Acetoin dehydrogenase n=1 Tax=Actinokineospora fastidiosa TaxID=1816 RepID=A0A918LAU7_9PSEU|nr:MULTISPECIES: SDR family NAD(P)-dependent oxidoreductase [Actinokineospora]UVS81778.1 Putative oxidoreductase SadH [Actinokineospora sp. UTMC 2448]GGS25364.1 acetoin dehydrogenase [Actinokineospora fastidiosa]